MRAMLSALAPRRATGAHLRAFRFSAQPLSIDSKKIQSVIDGAECLSGGGPGSFSIDTRQLLSQKWYIALRGKNHDGHTFVKEALQECVGVIVDRAHMGTKAGQSLVSLAHCVHKGVVVVPDTQQALTELAVLALSRYQGIVIAVTGSVGKTSCKSMIAHTLTAFQQRVSAAPASFNNYIGVPLTALEINGSDVAIFELGTSQQGEIAALASVVNPQIRVITDVQPSHLQGFATHSIEEVLHEKLELFKLARPTDSLVFNASNKAVWHSLIDPSSTRAPGLALGHHLWGFGDADVLFRGEIEDLSEFLRGIIVVLVQDVRCTLQWDAAGTTWTPSTTFKLLIHACGAQEAIVPPYDPHACSSCIVDSMQVEVPAIGRQLGCNAAAAVATVCAWMQKHQEVGTEAASCTGGHLLARKVARDVLKRLADIAWLQSWNLPPGRMTVHQLGKGTVILNDGYNANPSSMLSAIATMRDLEVHCTDKLAVRRLCVLGCMAELGCREQEYHQQVFRAAACVQEMSLFLWGMAWQNIVLGRQHAPGIAERRVMFRSNDVHSVVDAVYDWMEQSRKGSDQPYLRVILLKGSRTQRVEQVLELLQQKDQ